MKTTMKRTLSMLLCLVLMLSSLGLFTEKASAANRTGADDWLNDRTTSNSKNYVLSRIEYYFNNFSYLQNEGVVFMFEGASADPKQYTDGGVRNQAIAVVVNGNGEITYAEGNCTTIPDWPIKRYTQNDPPSAPTVCDGVYSIQSQLKGTQNAFRVYAANSSNDNLSCLRFYTNGTQKTAVHNPKATAIFVHRRGGETAFSSSNGSGRSEGCLLVGVGDDSFDTFYGKANTAACKYLVIDRGYAVNALKAFVYGEYTDENGYNAVNVLTGKAGSVDYPKPEIVVQSIGSIPKDKYNINGIVCSTPSLTSVTGEILQGNTAVQTCTVYPNAKTLNLVSSNINNNLTFGTLDPGDYELRITAVNCAGTTSRSVNFSVFLLGAPQISLNSIGSIPYGNPYNIQGTVTSQSDLISVMGEIISGNTVKQSCTVYPNDTTLNLMHSNINYKLKFGTLPRGSYKLQITAINAAGPSTASVDFVIGSELTISLKNINNVSYGRSYNIMGTVSSDAKLTYVRGEIISYGTVKQSCTVYPNAYSLNLMYSNINYKLRFGILPRGIYTLRIIARDANGETKSAYTTFRVV